MRNPHLKSVVAIDTPSATSTDDAGKIPVLGDSGRLDSAFLQAILESIGDLSSNGIICRTSATTVAARTLTAPAAGITVSNGDGVSGNPTLALANDLAGLEGLAGTGHAVRTTTDTWTTRTQTGTANEITVTNGDGVAGNPTYSLPAALTFTGKTVTGGTFNGGAFNGTLGATTPSTVACTTLNASGNCTLGDATTDSHTINGPLRNTTASNKHILTASVTSSGISDFTTGGAGITFSRPSDGVDGLVAVFQYTSSGGAFNLVSAARDDYVMATGGAASYTSCVEQLRLTSDGRLYGKSLHNNAGAITGTTNQYIASGTYTPTLTGVANVDSTTARVTQFMRVGNVVTVSGSMAVNATATTTTTVGVSLPVASNFANAFECAGTTGSATAASGRVYGDATNNRAEITYLAGGFASDEEIYFHFTYLIV